MRKQFYRVEYLFQSLKEESESIRHPKASVILVK